MKTVVVTGSSGFIGGYIVEELLRKGYKVVGVDNFSKYGRVHKSYDSHENYTLVEADVQDVALMTELLMDADHFIAGAALIGGISYFHTYAYDLLAQNEFLHHFPATDSKNLQLSTLQSLHGISTRFLTQFSDHLTVLVSVRVAP